MKKAIVILLSMGLFSCGGPEPRRPVEPKPTNFSTSVKRSKKLLALEEGIIAAIIKKDTLHTYRHSASGAWYYYEVQNHEATYTPQTDDLVTLAYNIMSLANDTIYSHAQIGIIKYKVDKQEMFPGLRNSIKLLKEKETATFLYPSSLAYGYHGDNDKIGTNVPIKSTITLLKIEKQEALIQN